MPTFSGGGGTAGGVAGGDLSGTYPNPAVAAGAITNAKVNAAAAIVASKLAGYPSDNTKTLLGDGTWGALPTSGLSGFPNDVTKGLRGDGNWKTSGVVEIATTTLAVDTANFDFANIDQTFSALMFVMKLRATTAAQDFQRPALRFNNDSAANYTWVNRWGDSAGNQNIGFSNSDSQMRLIACPAATSNANAWARVVLWIAGYTDTGWHSFTSQLTTASTVGADITSVDGGTHHSAAAVTRITLFPLADNWKAGSSVQMYGVP